MSRSRTAWRAMLLLGAAWAVLGAAAAAGARPQESEAATEFRPPVGRPMLLSRTLWRELADGTQIVATRRYRVRFSPDGTGWRVDGELVASEVEAPARLRALAELERARPDDGLFPIALDSKGEIASSEPRTRTQGGGTVGNAVRLALAGLAQQRPAAELAEVKAFSPRSRRSPRRR